MEIFLTFQTNQKKFFSFRFACLHMIDTNAQPNSPYIIDLFESCSTYRSSFVRLVKVVLHTSFGCCIGYASQCVNLLRCNCSVCVKHILDALYEHYQNSRRCQNIVNKTTFPMCMNVPVIVQSF